MPSFVKTAAASIVAGVALWAAAAGVATPQNAQAATCGTVASAGASRTKTARVSCAEARRFVRIWSNSCRGQGQGNLENCVIGLPSRPRVTLNCAGRPQFGMFVERCFSSDHKYRISFDADM